MLKPDQLNAFAEKVKDSGFPLEHWASSLLRNAGWVVTTNRYYIDSDNKKPRELDIVAFKEKHLGRFKVRTVLLLSCKKSQNSAWGFLRRPFLFEQNQINLFPVMATSKVPSVNYSLRSWEWPAKFCRFMSEKGLSDWFGVPKHDVFARQQFSLVDAKAKLTDEAMHSSTMQLIKAQAYEMLGSKKNDALEVTQFNLISLTEGSFVALNFEDNDSIHPEEISEQVALASYKIENIDHDSRILYLTKAAFKAGLERFTELHRLNVEFFSMQDKNFRDGAIFDSERRMVYIQDFISSTSNIVLQQTQTYSRLPHSVPHINISLNAVVSDIPIVAIAASDPEILDAAKTSAVKERIARDLDHFWGYAAEFKVDVVKII